MPTHDKETTDDAHSPQPAAQQEPGSGITDKIGGVANVIHGTGEVIRGYALEAGDFGRGHGKREIIAAGRDEVERGLGRIRIEGKSSATSDAVGDGTGAAPGHDPNTPQATATQRADPTVEKGRGEATDVKYPADRGTAGAAANAPPGHGDSLDAADGPGVQPNTDVRQQGNGIGSSDRDKDTRTTAGASYPADAAGQEQPSGTASQA